MELSYNSLNLLSEARQGNVVKATYTWLADGTKVGVSNANATSGYEYLGSLVYQRVNGNLQLESVAFAEGRIQNGTNQEIRYHLTDHLGSVRAIVNGVGADLARYDYTPMGVSRNPDNRLSTNRYTYNGKESQVGFGFDYLDYGARMRSSRYGPWNGQDVLAADYYPFSPYNFTLNNPISRIDPNGMSSDWYLNLYEARVEYHEGSKDRTNEALVHLAGDDASVGDIEDALTERGYEYRQDPSVEGGFRVDTEKQYKGWAMMQVFSPDNVGAVLGLASFSTGTQARSIVPRLMRNTVQEGAQGFSSFNAFKRAMGSAGEGQAWHHIVEQTPGNIAKFGNRTIHNTGNLMKLPAGPGSIHNQISAHYSSKPFFTNGQTVRQWLSTQSYQAQYDYGMKILKQLGGTP